MKTRLTGGFKNEVVHSESHVFPFNENCSVWRAVEGCGCLNQFCSDADWCLARQLDARWQGCSDGTGAVLNVLMNLPELKRGFLRIQVLSKTVSGLALGTILRYRPLSRE